MILIAHRGNTKGPNPISENTVDYIDEAIEQGYDAEIDVWMTQKGIYLGHDYPAYLVTETWLQSREQSLWIHCKNIQALSELHREFRVFFHNNDDYTITSDNWIWAYPGKYVPDGSRAIAVTTNLSRKDLKNYAGICSDYVSMWK